MIGSNDFILPRLELGRTRHSLLPFLLSPLIPHEFTNVCKIQLPFVFENSTRFVTKIQECWKQLNCAFRPSTMVGRCLRRVTWRKGRVTGFTLTRLFLAAQMSVRNTLIVSQNFHGNFHGSNSVKLTFISRTGGNITRLLTRRRKFDGNVTHSCVLRLSRNVIITLLLIRYFKLR